MMNTVNQAGIIPGSFADEIDANFTRYAYLTIEDRALPDARDGLKPSQRRLLVSMNDLKLRPNGAPKKCAKICGQTSGDYHPHGEQVVYPTLVRMAQHWVMRHALIVPQGNFGNIDGDPPAAMRYCLTSGHRVVTPSGKMVEISSLANSDENDGEREIEFDVVTMDGSTKTASRAFACGKHSVVKIRTVDGFELEGTENHPVMTIVQGLQGPETKWKLLSEVTTDDFVIMKRGGYNYDHEIPSDEKIDMAYLAGAFISEGSCNQIRASFGNTDEYYFNKVVEKYQQRVGSNYYIGVRTLLSGKQYHTFDVQNLTEYNSSPLSSIKNLSAEKRIPDFIWEGTWAEKRAFLAAAFEGDGCVSSLENCVIQIAYDTCSKTLANDVQLLLLQFGIISRVAYSEERNNYKVVVSNLVDAQRFAENIGFASHKITRLTDILESTGDCRRGMVRDFVPHLAEYVRNNKALSFKSRDRLKRINIDRLNKTADHYDTIRSKIDDPDVKAIYSKWINKRDFFYSQIESITKEGNKEVFSIRVDSDCHSFIANGFINHNTEAKLSPFAMLMLEDLSKDVVAFQPNYNEELEEPIILPAKIPNLLVNGASGIAVGYATSMAPHNLGEVLAATKAFIEDPDITVDDLMQIMPGPDFPNGGKILGRSGIRDYYTTGRGSVKLEGAWEVIEKGGKSQIIIRELPYMAGPTEFLNQLVALVEAEEINGISDARDLTSKKNGLCVQIDLSKGASADLILAILKKKTCLRKSFSVNQTVMIDGELNEALPLKGMLKAFVDFRELCLTRKFEAERKKNLERTEIVEGYIQATRQLDRAIQIIREADDPDGAKRGLLGANIVKTERQADAVLSMTLRSLTKLEAKSLEEELQSLKDRINWLDGVIGNSAETRKIIISELDEISKKHANERRSIIDIDPTDINEEDLIEDEKVMISLSGEGYVKRSPTEEYRLQKRGGSGSRGTSKKSQDGAVEMFEGSTKDVLFFFTTKGRVFQRKAYEIPPASKTSKGTHVSNMLDLAAEETVTNMISVAEIPESGFLVMVTKNGYIKRSKIQDYDSNRRNSGITGIKLDEEDEVAYVLPTSGNHDIFIVTEQGNAIRYSETIVKVQGRATRGSRALKLNPGDKVAQTFTLDPDENPEVFVITSAGYGKKTSAEQYRSAGSRNVKGCSVLKKDALKARGGTVVGACAIYGGESLLALTKMGQAIRFAEDDIRSTGRTTSGVKVVKLSDGDSVVKLATLAAEEEDNEQS